MKKYAVILSNTVENVYIVEAANSKEAEIMGVNQNNDPEKEPQAFTRSLDIAVNFIPEDEDVGDDEEVPTVSYTDMKRH